MLKASLNVLRFVKLTIKLVVLATSLYLGHAAYTIYFQTEQFANQHPIIYHNAGFYNEHLGSVIGWRLSTVTESGEKGGQEVLNLKSRSSGAERIGVPAMWLFFIAMCWLFRKSVMVITTLFAASIIGFGYYAYGWLQLGWPDEKMQFPSMFIAGMFGLATFMTFFGFHTLKFKLRPKSAIHEGQRRNTGLLIPWLHYTPYWAHLVFITYCLCMSIVAVEFEIIYYIFADGYPKLIPAGVFLVLYTGFLLFRFNKITLENEPLGGFKKSTLSDWVATAKASEGDRRTEKLDAFCQVASHFNLDDIEIYESNTFNHYPEVFAPDFFARKAILRIKVPNADWTLLQWKQYLTQAIVGYYSSTEMIKSLMESCSHDFYQLRDLGVAIVDKVYEDQKELDDKRYLLVTKNRYGREESHIVKKNEVTGVFRFLFALLILIPTLIVGVIALIFHIITWLYGVTNKLALKGDRIIIQAKVA